MEYFDINDPEIRERIIIENNLAFAFPTNIPIVVGHVLICPKRQVSKIEDLNDDELQAIFDLQKKMKMAMMRIFAAEGFNYAWNEGPVAGQSVGHFHLHMLPRKKGDTGVLEYEPRKFLYRTGDRAESPAQELVEVAELLKSALV